MIDFTWVLIFLGSWIGISLSATGLWILVRNYYIRKFKREDARMSKDDKVFATVQEFRSELS